MKLCKSCAKQVFDFADKKEKEAEELNKVGKQIASAFGGLGEEIGKIGNSLTKTVANIVSGTGNTFKNMAGAVNQILVDTFNALPKPKPLQIVLISPFKPINQALEQSVDKLAENVHQGSEETSQAFGQLTAYLGQGHEILVEGNSLLVDSQQKLTERIRESNRDASQSLIKVGQGIKLAAASFKRPLDESADFLERVNIGANTFSAIVFDPAPTIISDVLIEEIGKDYVVVSWRTNHYAWGKVNYGKDLMYGEEVILTEREKYHQAKLIGLEPGERYYFEVMSQNKNYVYDAYYSFETSEE